MNDKALGAAVAAISAGVMGFLLWLVWLGWIMHCWSALEAALWRPRRVGFDVVTG